MRNKEIMETNSEKLPNFAIKFANIVFFSAIILSVLIAGYVFLKILNNPKTIDSTFYYIVCILAISTAILFIIGINKLGYETKFNCSLILFSTLIIIYGFEIFLNFWTPSQIKSTHKDARTEVEVIQDFRDLGIKSYPLAGPDLHFNILNSQIYNLGAISDTKTVLCREGVDWTIYQSDEHGFNNPKELYNNNLDIILAGDSFTHGHCVKPDETISAVLHKAGFNAINIAMGGNGPLKELASIKEYAQPLKPKIVIWLYYVNDLTDLEKELKSPFLKQYLEDSSFSQNLFLRQKEIDIILTKYLDERWKSLKKAVNRDKIEGVMYVVKLTNLRLKFALLPQQKLIPSPIFKDVLENANDMVSKWNGKLYFVYLPRFLKYSAGKGDINREFVIKTVSELNIPIIDIHKEVFNIHPDPLSLFPFRKNGHYNAEGYRLVAESIKNRIITDGVIEK